MKEMTGTGGIEGHHVDPETSQGQGLQKGEGGPDPGHVTGGGGQGQETDIEGLEIKKGKNKERKKEKGERKAYHQ